MDTINWLIDASFALQKKEEPHKHHVSGVVRCTLCQAGKKSIQEFDQSISGGN